MNIPFIDAKTLRATLSYRGLVEHLRAAHCKPPPQVQRVLMQESVAGGQDNGFLIWPAWQHGSSLGIKVCTLFPQNRDVPTVQALYALFDGQNGSPQALIDGTEMTYWKTAADSALGADLLARPDIRTLLVVGAGAMASHMVRAYRAIRPGITRVLVWNRTVERARALVQGIEGVQADVADDLALAVISADAVCCVTASSTPLIQGQWLRPGTHVDLIGGYTPQMRETDDEVMRRARIFVDSRWFTVDIAGDLTQPIAAGVISRDDVLGDLFDLCSGRVAARQSPSEITLFKSGGGAHLDLMAAQYIAERNL